MGQPAQNTETTGDVFEAVSHPGRRAMLRLVVRGERRVAELAEHVGLSQPATSQHLKVLRDAGLVKVRVDGPRRLYSADRVGLDRLRRELDDFWPAALDTLKQVAESKEKP